MFGKRTFHYDEATTTERKGWLVLNFKSTLPLHDQKIISSYFLGLVMDALHRECVLQKKTCNEFLFVVSFSWLFVWLFGHRCYTQRLVVVRCLLWELYSLHLAFFSYQWCLAYCLYGTRHRATAISSPEMFTLMLVEFLSCLQMLRYWSVKHPVCWGPCAVCLFWCIGHVWLSQSSKVW